MAQEQTKITSQTLVPISLIVSICVVVWTFWVTYQRIQALEERNSPTRNEFTTLQNDISEIKQDVKLLIKASK